MTTMTRRLAAVPRPARTLVVMMIVMIFLMITLMLAVTKTMMMMVKSTKSIVADMCRESASP